MQFQGFSKAPLLINPLIVGDILVCSRLRGLPQQNGPTISLSYPIDCTWRALGAIPVIFPGLGAEVSGVRKSRRCERKICRRFAYINRPIIHTNAIPSKNLVAVCTFLLLKSEHGEGCAVDGKVEDSSPSFVPEAIGRSRRGRSPRPAMLRLPGRPETLPNRLSRERIRRPPSHPRCWWHRGPRPERSKFAPYHCCRLHGDLYRVRLRVLGRRLSRCWFHSSWQGAIKADGLGERG